MNIQDFNKQFPSNDACLLWLFTKKFGTPTCPKCKRVNKYYAQKKKGEHEKGDTLSSHFVCVCGQHQLSPKKGTIFEKSDTNLYKWFYTMYLFSISKNGVAAKELQKELGVTYKTAWRMGHQIRILMAQTTDKLTGTVEVDETFFGKKSNNKDKFKVKSALMGMVERKGLVKAQTIEARHTHIVLNAIKDNIKKDAHIMSDEFKVYAKLPKLGYQSSRIKHGKEHWVMGNIHTNTIEGFWGQLKRSISGTYHFVSAQHLQKYVDEFCYRYNYRLSSSVFDQMVALL